MPKGEVEYNWIFYVIKYYFLKFVRYFMCYEIINCNVAGTSNNDKYKMIFHKYHEIHIAIHRAHFPWPYYSALIFATKWTRNQFMMENTPVQQKVKCQLENYTENPQPYILPIYNIEGIKIWYYRMSHRILLIYHWVDLSNLIIFNTFMIYQNRLIEIVGNYYRTLIFAIRWVSLVVFAHLV